MAQLIDGKLISQQIKDELKEEVAQFKAKGIDICLAVIQVGSDPASSVYVRNKKKACAYIGVESRSGVKTRSLHRSVLSSSKSFHTPALVSAY